MANARANSVRIRYQSRASDARSGPVRTSGMLKEREDRHHQREMDSGQMRNLGNLAARRLTLRSSGLPSAAAELKRYAA